MQKDSGIGNWMADEILWRSRIAFVRSVISHFQSERIYTAATKEVWDALVLSQMAGNDRRIPGSSIIAGQMEGIAQNKEALIREKINGRVACWSPAWQTYH